MKHFFLLTLLVLPSIALAQSGDFVPLLPSLPGIDTLQNQDSLAPFLSQIYKICIGLAAVLAVLQIMRAGVMYMGGDSITEKKEARNLIGTALAGLLLVLSPVIVFSIINPKILDLEIGAERLRSGLETANFGVEEASTVYQVSSPKECTDVGGTVSGDANTVLCTVPSNSPAANKAYGSCGDYRSFTVIPNNTTCQASGADEGAISISTQCCSQKGLDVPSGSKCCAVYSKTVVTLPDPRKPITILEYVEGVSKNYGPLTAADKELFANFTKACTENKGKVVKTQKEIRDCTADEEKLMTTIPEEKRKNIGCRTVTVGCSL